MLIKTNCRQKSEKINKIGLKINIVQVFVLRLFQTHTKAPKIKDIYFCAFIWCASSSIKFNTLSERSDGLRLVLAYNLEKNYISRKFSLNFVS